MTFLDYNPKKSFTQNNIATFANGNSAYSKMFTRVIQQDIIGKCFKDKVIILIGARQVGKTTLLKDIIREQSERTLYLNCDEPQTVNALSNRNLKELQLLAGANRLIVIDEAQKVENIGLTLKLMADNMPEVQVIATGSSAFELRNQLNEPLTGRKFEYQMFPISTEELYITEGYLEVSKRLESRLIFGSYPDILNNQDDPKELLQMLTDSYLYKDILSTENLRKPDMLDKLLRALAFQVGSEVSHYELAQTIGSDSKTVERYIDLLEKCFVIFRLNGLNRNLRNELKKAKKIYFYDNGVRNAVIRQFAPAGMRNDMGALWENFFISERIKYNHYRHHFCNYYFWRTKTQQEIDLIEEADGSFNIFEMKWNPNKSKTGIPKSFLESYPVSAVNIVTPENYMEHLVR